MDQPAEDGVELLTELLVTALDAGPETGRDDATGRMAAQLLVALARSGANDVVAAALGLGLGEEAGYEVRRFDPGSIVVTSVAGPMAAPDAVLTASGLASASPEAIEVVALVPGGTERVVLTRAAGGPLVHRGPATEPWPDRAPAGEPWPEHASLAPVELPTPDAWDVPALADAVRSVLAEATVEVDVSGVEQTVREAVREAVAGALSTAAPPAAEPAAPPEPVDPSVVAERVAARLADDRIDPGEVAERVAARLADDRVDPVEPGEVADRVVARLVEERRAPRAHDVADIVGTLMPTASDVADLVAASTAQQMVPLQEAATAAARTLDELESRLPSSGRVAATVSLLLGDQLNAASEAIAREVATARGQMASAADSIARRIESLAGETRRADGDMARRVETFADQLAGATSKVAQDVTAVRAGITAVQEGLSVATDAFGRDVVAVAVSVDSLGREIATLAAEGAVRHQASLRAVDTALDRVVEEVAARVPSPEAVSGDLAALGDRMAEAVASMRDAVAELQAGQQAIATALARFEARLLG
jgi:hypothetical protein